MSYLLPHLTSGWAVDQAILSKKRKAPPSSEPAAQDSGFGSRPERSGTAEAGGTTVVLGVFVVVS